MDFWESLAAEMPRNLDYAKLYKRFAWDLPQTYNIGVDVCDRHARDKGRLAIIHDRGDGTAEKWSFWELERTSDRFANALRSAGGREESEGVAAELQSLVRDRLGAHEYPREVEFVEELPMTATGKIRRNVLREGETGEGAKR